MIRFTAVSACALLTLAACNRAEERVSEPAAAPVASANETPATPSAHPNALTAEGLGPVRIGMSRSAATLWRGALFACSASASDKNCLLMCW